jgi:hypothetical protein
LVFFSEKVWGFSRRRFGDFLGEGLGIFSEKVWGFSWRRMGTHRAREARGEEFGVRRELSDFRDVPPELSPGEVMLKNLRRGYRGS